MRETKNADSDAFPIFIIIVRTLQNYTLNMLTVTTEITTAMMFSFGGFLT